jgi:hypothetical protein
MLLYTFGKASVVPGFLNSDASPPEESQHATPAWFASR